MDYVNNFVHSAEMLHLMNTIFLDADDVSGPPCYSKEAGALIFVPELRMGFGLHPNSIIVQYFSEALNAVLREDVDQEEDPLLEADTRPSVQAWLAERRTVESHKGGHQHRLYFVEMYCDDNIIGVLGAQRAVRVLKPSAQAMAQTNQRCGPHYGHPGEAAVSGSVVQVDRRSYLRGSSWSSCLAQTKLIRASEAIRALLLTGIEFSEYRSLMGLVEREFVTSPSCRVVILMAFTNRTAVKGRAPAGQTPSCGPSCSCRFSSPSGSTFSITVEAAPSPSCWAPLYEVGCSVSFPCLISRCHRRFPSWGRRLHAWCVLELPCPVQRSQLVAHYRA